MKFLNRIGLFPLVVASLIAGPAQASLIQADFYTEAHYPDIEFFKTPLVHEARERAVGAGFELTSADKVNNNTALRGGQVWVDYNPISNILTLDSRDRWDFQTFSLDITEMLFSDEQRIVDFRVLEDQLTRESVTPQLNFTENTLHINYDARPGFFFFSGERAQFQVDLGAARIPEPGTLALFLIGLTGLVVGRTLKPDSGRFSRSP